MAKPAVDRLERDLAEDLQVVRLSVFDSIGRRIAAEHGIRGVPSFLLFDGAGQLVQYQAGRLDSDRVKQEVKRLRR